MIRARQYHPQANVLVRAHAAANAMRFAGTEADSTFTPVCEAEAEQPIDWPTTRRYPRTLTGVDSAYPNDAAYADPFARFEHQLAQDKPAESRSWTWGVRCVYAIAAGVALGLYKGWIR